MIIIEMKILLNFSIAQSLKKEKILKFLCLFQASSKEYKRMNKKFVLHMWFVTKIG
jgi:hypothetical protein